MTTRVGESLETENVEWAFYIHKRKGHMSALYNFVISFWRSIGWSGWQRNCPESLEKIGTTISLNIPDLSVTHLWHMFGSYGWTSMVICE